MRLEVPAAGTIYKVAVQIPPGHLDAVMDSVTGVITPVYPGYTRVFTYWPVKGTWIPSEGSDPFIGNVGCVETADEIRLEFAVSSDEMPAAVAAVRRVHPYEEPAIDIIPMIPWKSVIPSDDSCRDCRRSSASCGS